jgi:hypothetical protein
MIEYILANQETGEERPNPRDDGGTVIGIQQPPWMLLRVIREPAPELLPNQAARPIKTKDYTAATITHTWEIEQLPPPGPDYQGFYDALIDSLVYSAVVTSQGKTGDQAAAMTVFLGAIQETKNNKENRPALQYAIWILLSEITLPVEGYAELQGLLNEYHLSEIYQLQPPGG